MPSDWSFWWGISSSSYQTEDAGPPEENLGFETDWDVAARAGKLKEPRGQATWSYTCTARDIAAMKAMGVTHYRFSVEWARVEPKPGEFNEAAIEHYVMLARELHASGITPVVTLWHFTFPSWLGGETADTHGWLHPDFAARWEAYVQKMATALSPLVRDFAPENEPNSYALGVLVNYFPPGGRASYGRYLRTYEVQAEAFRTAARIIREVRPDARIISVQNIIHWEIDGFDFFQFWYKKGLEYNYYHLDKIADVCDWIGINYYCSEIASPLALGARNSRHDETCSDMGWFIDAEGLEKELAALADRYGKPIIIMENGIADETDLKRQRYLLEHILAVRRAKLAGCDIRGYFHWSLIDNYEWADGYGPKFGLYRLDRDTREIIPKESADLYRLIITDGVMSDPLRPIEPMVPTTTQPAPLPLPTSEPAMSQTN